MQTEEEYKDSVVLQAKRWKTIYPQYIDKTLSQNEGRKISQKIAVPNPTLAEIAQALRSLRLHSVIEADKKYSKNWLVRGRIKVKLYDDDHNRCTDFKNKLALLKKVCEIIPTLPNRQENPEGKPVPGSKAYAMEMEFLNQQNQQQQQQEKAQESSGGGKKNKKKKR